MTAIILHSSDSGPECGKSCEPTTRGVAPNPKLADHIRRLVISAAGAVPQWVIGQGRMVRLPLQWRMPDRNTVHFCWQVRWPSGPPCQYFIAIWTVCKKSNPTPAEVDFARRCVRLNARVRCTFLPVSLCQVAVRTGTTAYVKAIAVQMGSFWQGRSPNSTRTGHAAGLLLEAIWSASAPVPP